MFEKLKNETRLAVVPVGRGLEERWITNGNGQRPERARRA